MLFIIFTNKVVRSNLLELLYKEHGLKTSYFSPKRKNN
ncbi:hypothetical protein RU98_GL001355 [Enterococcus caccae]|nr:hypothetical protein RU98_GL001355 [Enterococcus caccae]